jgi:hypothetical protein
VTQDELIITVYLRYGASSLSVSTYIHTHAHTRTHTHLRTQGPAMRPLNKSLGLSPEHIVASHKPLSGEEIWGGGVGSERRGVEVEVEVE